MPDKTPYAGVGVDYFGPLEVKRGRSLLKSYGVFFTCLTSRAVHLEVAHTIDTDSRINAVQRFICGRAPVSSLRSDLIQDGIKWSFNTPAASHQGGIWERLIHSVKGILSSIVGQQVLDDEGLQTPMTSKP